MPDSTHPRRQPGPDRSEGGGGIVDLYAKRVAANAASRDTTADQDDAPPVTEWIGRGSELESVDDPGPGGSNDGAPLRLSFATGARRLLRLGSRRGRVAIGGLLVASLALSALSGVAHAQQRYTVRDGDTLGGVAARFGVDPDAILNASWVANPGTLTAGDVIVIPDPGQDPADAAAEAAQREGTSPWVSAAYDVQANDTIAEIAATYGVAADDLLALNNLTWNDDIFPGQRLLIPADATVRAEPESGGAQFDGGAVPSGGGAFAGVPLHQQERSLSCEYAAAFIATSAYGAGIPESAFSDRIPVTLNPHDGYRGNIDGVWGNYVDYGVYPEPLVPVLNAYGFSGEVFYGDLDLLRNHLDAGHPVIVWLAVWGDTRKVYADQGTYSVFAGEHVVTAYAYDDTGIYFSDPGQGRYVHMSWGTFSWMWGGSDGMSLAVYPS